MSAKLLKRGSRVGNRYARRMLTVPVAVLAIVGVSTASAATTWTVRPGARSRWSPGCSGWQTPGPRPHC